MTTEQYKVAKNLIIAAENKAEKSHPGLLAHGHVRYDMVNYFTASDLRKIRKNLNYQSEIYHLRVLNKHFNSVTYYHSLREFNQHRKFRMTIAKAKKGTAIYDFTFGDFKSSHVGRWKNGKHIATER